MKLSLLVLFSLAWCTSAAEHKRRQRQIFSKPGNGVGCGVQSSSFQPDLKSSRIINGVEAKPNSWPWMASILEMQRHNCGATLLRVRDDVESSDILLTAAHCIEGSQPQSMTVVLGKHRQNTEGKYEQKRQAAALRPHPKFGEGGSLSNDVGLIKLASPIQFSEVIRPLCLAQQGAAVPSDQICVTIGWGKTATTSSPIALQQLVLPVHPASTCKSSWAGKFNETAMICAGSLKADKGACHGDSGSMLACKQSDGRWVQFGVTSWGIPNTCLEKNKPGVFARVSSYIDWIKKNMQEMTSL